jgi:SHS2 domain-containing protein
MSTGPAPFEFLDEVTSDLCFAARGATLPEVFAAAAEALLDATVEHREALHAAEERRLELTEPDLELLLLRFLNELIYLRDADGLLLRPRELRVEELPGQARLVAELVGERLDPARHHLRCDVKAATAHGLALAREGGRFRATVTLDV